MVEAHLLCHKGAVPVSVEQLEAIEAPPPTATWFPVKHSDVLNKTTDLLQEAGYRIDKSEYAISHEGHRFFGTLRLNTQLTDGACLAVGIRNSTDQTFPMSFCAGNSVFVCDNLAFRAELMVKRKHTTFGKARFSDAISAAISSLPSFQNVEATRIEYLRQEVLTEEKSDHLLLQAALQEIISYRDLPKIWEEYRNPKHDHGGKTLWTLLQAATQVLGPLAKRNPNAYCAKTIKLNHLLLPTLAV